MRPARRWCLALFATVGIVAGSGCRGGKPAVETSMTEVTVTGTITKGGQPITAGTVIFDPANYRRKDVMPRSAEINDDGTYTITTLIGSNMVEVHAVGASGRAMDSEHDFVAKAGENTFDIELP